MNATEQWISAGQIVESRDFGRTGTQEATDSRLRTGAIRVVSGHSGTEFRWVCDSPCLASLYAIAELLIDWRPPFVFRFFLAGWMEEKLEDPQAAKLRILTIAATCDKPNPRPVFVVQKSPMADVCPPILSRVLATGLLPPDLAVECIYSQEKDAFLVNKIGQQSTIARIFGTSVSSYPCLSAGPYGTAISASYSLAVKERTPRYEHVLASLVMPDRSRRWVPYHRIVVPQNIRHLPVSVTVVSEFAPVEIDLI